MSAKRTKPKGKSKQTNPNGKSKQAKPSGKSLKQLYLQALFFSLSNLSYSATLLKRNSSTYIYLVEAGLILSHTGTVSISVQVLLVGGEIAL